MTVQLYKYNYSSSTFDLYYKHITEALLSDPITIPPQDYEGGSQWVVSVTFNWKKVPQDARDYTVKLYSKHDLEIYEGHNRNERKMDDVSDFTEIKDFKVIPKSLFSVLFDQGFIKADFGGAFETIRDNTWLWWNWFDAY